jgi:hypothetical protein
LDNYPNILISDEKQKSLRIELEFMNKAGKGIKRDYFFIAVYFAHIAK